MLYSWPETVSFFLRASDLNVGWVFLKDAKSAVHAVVCVLPKPWATGKGCNDATRPGKLHPMAGLPAGRSGWICFQGDVIARPKDPEKGKRDGDEIARAVWDKLATYANKRPGPEETQLAEQRTQLSDGLMDADTDHAARSRRLFLAGFNPGKLEGDDKPQDAKYQQALITLLERINTPDWDEALSMVRDPIFRVVVAKRYIDVLHAAARHLRRGYVQHREMLGSPRGRIVPASAARAEDSGSPAVECQFEEFTFDRPLYRVLATALQCALSVVSNEPTGLDDILRRAAALRHQLADIAALPVAQARSQAMRLQLLPSERLRWEPARRLAVAVLNDWSPLAEQEHNRHDAFDVSIQTAPLWETLIAEALETATPRVRVTIGHRRGVESGSLKKERVRLEVSQPWELSGAPFACDLIADFGKASITNQRRYVIVDAKYMRIPVGKVPFKPERRKYVPVEHTRQVFAYGALWRDKDGRDDNDEARPATVDVALVYLSCGEEKSTDAPQDDVTGKLHRLCDKLKGFPGLTLQIVEMPFPAISDCASRPALNAWLSSESGGACVGNALGLMT